MGMILVFLFVGLLLCLPFVLFSLGGVWLIDRINRK